ncbi:NAD-dependent protein deacetylase [Candidatus Aquiluna sp. UB-MaderosW2red]|uniref:NAD-dependent protein deacetylase n=1 Tax=Candidatus Aquiluna sp. UB-MaderosW2red TaxID=1855377 RepID=UPI000875AB36|nr:NAD-dependent protein deacetylase [Candidatus Aquiluna sp. UB-MaderosW2red]SCX12252.1 NAD-dependent protein deacetylase, SIR2 family [Candidatus Aquiluna sp. UB-MaderosW2red]
MINSNPETQLGAIQRARDLLKGQELLVLTGAGISTDSGIPDYRGAGRVEKHPLTFDEFMGSRANQARYWARSYVGWSRVALAEPNLGHFALAEAEQLGMVQKIITQNVDGLHQRSGSKSVLELHGRLDRVLCSGCGDILSRNELDARISFLNPDVYQDQNVEYTPDGDAEVEVGKNFRVPDCGQCGAHFKPDVVFFGEQVPMTRVLEAQSAVDVAQAVLVAGTSLTVNSGLRLIKRAQKRGIPIVIVNLGETRGDQMATLKIHGSTSELLKEILF